jgi:hypothetical protein
MVVWKMPTFLMSRRLTVEHSYSKKMLESGDNQIKKKTRKGTLWCFCVFRDAAVLWFRLHHITIVFVTVQLAIKSLKKGTLWCFTFPESQWAAKFKKLPPPAAPSKGSSCPASRVSFAYYALSLNFQRCALKCWCSNMLLFWCSKMA